MGKRLTTRNLLVFVILVLAGALLATIVHNFREGGPEEVLQSLPEDVDLALKKIHYTETRDGKRRWTLKADAAAHDLSENFTRIENMHMTFYEADDTGRIDLTARHGAMQSDQRSIEARGDVVIKSSRGYALYTEHLQYLEGDRLLRTDDPVRLVSEKLEVTGRGLRFDVRDQSLELLSDVQAEIAWGEKG